ncbi:glycine betaine/L-proline ABC transporter ATP-binding protein [Halocella sp. SP3-1]|uniref:quaternary amine ABC transporter ATP-binding protein n=1 Tax=Halocella sp. SP3-1 TaxID=2382161 RepID=UPI000F762E1A|nr:glycine betaine/L-proline ABC transporter ATP-binding protein [Halocella sp. SP3-1]AZO96044.1 glycine betaine/L-proline ABC transporter ATP-binding protein [Halocella sp. SP3-1]MTI60152.1 glycine betaine/L-proline ABC transporter ATP-binding protein [Bacillota bacterium]
MNKIEVKNLYKIYGPRPKEVIPLLKKGLNKDDILQKTKHSVGVNNINFNAKEGEVFVIMGLSGSGKSTLIRCMNRLIEPTQGEILLDGEDLTKMDKEALREVRRHKLAMVFQHFALFPHRTVLENVEYGFEIQHIKKPTRKEIALQALKQVGLKEWHDHKPANLSGGMQQRVGLARALAIDPDILLMDEAFSALDPLIRRDMQNELLNLQSKLHKTIIFITHDLDEALRIGDRIAILNEEGQIVQIGEPEEILSNPANNYVAKFVQGVNRLKVLTAEDVMFRPDALIHLKDGPNMALKTMTREGFSSLYVVDSNKKVAGVIDIDRAVQAKKDRSKNLDKYLDKDFAQAKPDTPLTELLPMTSQTAYPIAITDDSKRLLGIIVRVTILSSLAEGSVADD